MSIKNIILKEIDNNNDLYPFSIMHTSWEMRCGCLKIFEKYEVMFPQKNLYFHSSDALLKSFQVRTNLLNDEILEGGALVILGNVLPTFTLLDSLQKAVLANDWADLKFESNGSAFAYYINKIENIEELDGILTNHDALAIEVPCELVRQIHFIWELLDYNAQYIALDLLLLEMKFRTIAENEFKGVHLINPELIHLGENVSISCGVVLDASKGEIVIDDNATIMPNAVILGPTYIGKDSTIKIGAKIYGNCSFGEQCKVGGELEAVIFQEYSNKQHDGFLGHSFIGEWVNLGADTNNSDLKNTYSNIVMRLPGKRVPTSKMFIGLMAGDHTKSAINTQFTTGTSCGIHSNLFDSGFMPNQIPSFTWGGSTGSKKYKFDDAIATAKIVMARRGKELSYEEIELMKVEFDRISQ